MSFLVLHKWCHKSKSSLQYQSDKIWNCLHFFISAILCRLWCAHAFCGERMTVMPPLVTMIGLRIPLLVWIIYSNGLQWVYTGPHVGHYWPQIPITSLKCLLQQMILMAHDEKTPKFPSVPQLLFYRLAIFDSVELKMNIVYVEFQKLFDFIHW